MLHVEQTRLRGKLLHETSETKPTEEEKRFFVSASRLSGATPYRDALVGCYPLEGVE